VQEEAEAHCTAPYRAPNQTNQALFYPSPGPLTVQEEAEAHCTAPYRAPELFDVASQCTIDERVDTWSLGCLLCVSSVDRNLTI